MDAYWYTNKKEDYKGQTTPLRIVRNNTTYTNNDDIADRVNKHFVNVGPNLASKIADSSVNPTQYISFSPSSSLVMSTVTENQVSSLFKTLDTNKSSLCGFENIRIRLDATFSFRIRLPSTRIRRIRQRIRKKINPLSRVWTGESGYFRIR